MESSLQLAGAALERLDREVNGGVAEANRARVRCEALLRTVVGRWRARVALAGGSLELHWRAGDASVLGDPAALEQAIDNLVVNAVEHGGPAILVEGARLGDRVRVAVMDSGRRSRGQAGEETPREALARLSGRRRHGHGLAIVRRTAAEHGGRFALRVGESGSMAVLELPLSPEDLAA